MAQEQTVKCRFCKKEIPKSQAYKVGDRTYFCNEECYKHQENKNKYKPKKTTNDGEINPRRLLTDYIMNIYIDNGYDKHNINWELLTAQIKNFMKDNNKITYGGIQYTLWYLIEIEEKDLFNCEEFNGSILNLVPTNYIKAKQYCEEMIKLQKEINEFEFEDKEIIINKSFSNKKKRKMLTFD